MADCSKNLSSPGVHIFNIRDRIANGCSPRAYLVKQLAHTSWFMRKGGREERPPNASVGPQMGGQFIYVPKRRPLREVRRIFRIAPKCPTNVLSNVGIRDKEITPCLITRNRILPGAKIIVSDRTAAACVMLALNNDPDRKSTRLNSSHLVISYAVF